MWLKLLVGLVMISWGLYERRMTKKAQSKVGDLEVMDQIRINMPRAWLLYSLFGCVTLLGWALDSYGA
jgi:hypothetical protein